MRCSHIDDFEEDTDYICAEWWGEEGCDFRGEVVAKGCSGSWYITCPKCKKETINEQV